MPAHYANAASIGVLPPTLAPDGFAGRVREGYQAAQAIPKTLAQLPCYCYCDQGAGHKSLHSCFEDSHGAHCGVCVDEALFAYKLEKDQGFSPAEIREMVKKRFGRNNCAHSLTHAPPAA
ncbi:MAG: CYCXC family (seleno)protein [Pyrinomonadaceae bacterium]